MERPETYTHEQMHLNIGLFVTHKVYVPQIEICVKETHKRNPYKRNVLETRYKMHLNKGLFVTRKVHVPETEDWFVEVSKVAEVDAHEPAYNTDE